MNVVNGEQVSLHVADLDALGYFDAELITPVDVPFTMVARAVDQAIFLRNVVEEAFDPSSLDTAALRAEYHQNSFLLTHLRCMDEVLNPPASQL